MKENKSWTITYNAKFTLSFALIASIILLLNSLSNGVVNNSLALLSHFSITGIHRTVTYIFCHADFQHLMSNLLYLLILGPMLEEKYGARLLLIMTFFTAVFSALINTLLFSSGIIGASGIVFMFIVLSSIVNMKEKEIPLTFLLVVLIYLGGEIVRSFDEDSISQFVHVMGGLCGGLMGFLLKNAPSSAKETS